MILFAALKMFMDKTEEDYKIYVGDYRLLCHIDDGKLIILALSVGHRREVYEN